MGRSSAAPADGSGTGKAAAKPNAKAAAKSNAKAAAKARGGKAGPKAGAGAGATAPPTPAPPAAILPDLPLPILQLSLAVPSPLSAPTASACGAATLGALSAALADTTGRSQPAGDVRRTLGSAVAEWVKALGGVGDGGGGGVVDNVGRYVAAEIAALPVDNDGATERGDASDLAALGKLLGSKLNEFGERRITGACQAVGATVAASVLRAGDEVVVWGVGSQLEVVAALESAIASKVPFRLTVITPSGDDEWPAPPQSFRALPFPTHTPTFTPYTAAASAFGFSPARSVLLLPARFVASNGAVVTARGGGGLAVAAKRRGALVAVLTISLGFGAEGRLRERRPWPRPSGDTAAVAGLAGGGPADVAEDVIDPQWIDAVVTEDGVIGPAMAPQVDKAFNSFA